MNSPTLPVSQKYERLPSRLAPPELKEVFPLGKAPILQDGDITLAESGAIVGTKSHSLY
jgi:glutathione S-transferase